MQRGREQNKFDLDDTMVLLEKCVISTDYSKQRSSQINLDSRAKQFLAKAGLKI